MALHFMLLAPHPGQAQTGRWQVGAAPTFSSGTYGTDRRTEILQTPITARRLFADGDVTVIVPFLCIWGNGDVTIVNGAPVRQQRIANVTAPARGARAATGTASSSVAPGAAAGVSAPNCGIGDLVARGRYYVLDERGWAPTIAVRGHVKAPTASAGQGLGTGRPDEGVGLEISRTIGRTILMVDGGYTVIGNPEGVEYRNNWWYDVGLGLGLVRRGATEIGLSVFFEDYRSIVPGLGSARDVLAAVSVSGAAGWRLQVAGAFGLSDAAPDHGVTIGVNRRF